MLEVADVFRRFAADYLDTHGASMPPSHRRAIEDILDCRTAALGGQVWRCDACDAEVFSYHSCGNRSCPKCHTRQTQQWLEHRQAEMLPVPYFHITVTVPAELRAVLRAHQRDGYAVLMRATACAIVELARDPRYVGGTVAVLAVLHTWGFCCKPPTVSEQRSRALSCLRLHGLELLADQLDGFGEHACAEAEGALDQTRLAKDVARQVEHCRLTLSERTHYTAFRREPENTPD